MRSAKTGKATVASGSPSSSRRKTKDVVNISQKRRLFNRILRLTLKYIEAIEAFDTALYARTANVTLMGKMCRAAEVIRKAIEKYDNRSVTTDEVENYVYSLRIKKLFTNCRLCALIFNITDAEALKRMIRGEL
jgi:hypothetical protein